MYHHSNASSSGHQLAQESQPLCHQLGGEQIDARQVATWSGEARHETEEPSRRCPNRRELARAQPARTRQEAFELGDRDAFGMLTAAVVCAVLDM